LRLKLRILPQFRHEAVKPLDRIASLEMFGDTAKTRKFRRGERGLISLLYFSGSFIPRLLTGVREDIGPPFFWRFALLGLTGDRIGRCRQSCRVCGRGCRGGLGRRGGR
jgi:hypothetical protein